MGACKEKLLESGQTLTHQPSMPGSVCGILRADYLCLFYWALCLSLASCVSFHHSQGVGVLWRADGNSFSPSEMTSRIVANTRGERTHAGCDPASQSPSRLAAEAETSRDCAKRADPGSCGTCMPLCNECCRCNPRSPPSG